MEQRIPVLLVCEHLDRAFLIPRLLQASGYDTQIVPLSATVEDVLQHEPSLIVLDVEGYSKKTFGYWCNIRPQSIPILALAEQGRDKLTHQHPDFQEAEALDIGVDEFLYKPISPRRLIVRIQALLRRPAFDGARTT